MVQHLGGDDLNALNNDQRIILASHRFAPEVTSAALWLNEKASGEDLVTCVTLTPYRDSGTDSLYIQAVTIIPVPGEEDYVIGIGDNLKEEPAGSSTFAVNLRRTFQRHKGDEVTAFVKKVGQLTSQGLLDETRPNRISKWAGEAREGFRYYNLWYSWSPWRGYKTCYAVTLHPQKESESWYTYVHFTDKRNPDLPYLDGIQLHDDQKTHQSRITVGMGVDTLNDQFANRIADMLRQFIETNHAHS